MSKKGFILPDKLEYYLSTNCSRGYSKLIVNLENNMKMLLSNKNNDISLHTLTYHLSSYSLDYRFEAENINRHFKEMSDRNIVILCSYDVAEKISENDVMEGQFQLLELISNCKSRCLLL